MLLHQILPKRHFRYHLGFKVMVVSWMVITAWRYPGLVSIWEHFIMILKRFLSHFYALMFKQQILKFENNVRHDCLHSALGKHSLVIRGTGGLIFHIVQPHHWFQMVPTIIRHILYQQFDIYSQLLPYNLMPVWTSRYANVRNFSIIDVLHSTYINSK